MTKTYNSPMLQVVSINKSDIIVTSPLSYGGSTDATSGNLGADRFRDDWDAGY